jgi:vitamin B12 transporter
MCHSQGGDALHPTAIALAAGLVAARAFAAEPAERDSAAAVPVVVTATRTPQLLSETVRPVELITEEVIDESGQSTLTELLQSQAGVEIAANGGAGQPSSVFIRGANSSHTLVLLDGIRLNNASIGTTPFENLPSTQFSRIEVVPGPLSSLYGPDAIGGVIQLFTRRWPDAPRVSGAAGYGSYGTTGINGGLSAGTASTGFALSAGHFESNGFSATNPSVPFSAFTFNPDDDGYRNTNLSGNIVHRFSPDHEIGVGGFYVQGRTHFDSGPTTDDINDQTIGVYSLYSRNRFSPWWQSVVRVGVSQDESQISGSFPGEFSSYQTQATWQNDLAMPIGTLIAGLEFLRQEAGGTSVFAVDERDIYSIFGGYSGQIGRHALYASVRNDDNSQFGNQTTGALGYAFALTSELRVRAGAGTAFHAPTFTDLYLVIPFFFTGNPNLAPEEGKSWEAGVDYRTGLHRFGATYFDNRITDLIVFNAAAATPQNVDEASIKGVELAYDGALLGWELRARLTLQDPVNDRTGKRLPRRAEFFGNLGITRSFGRWRVGGEVVGAGERFDSLDEAPASRMDGYAIVNLVAGYSIARDWKIDLRWNNVLDTDYELAKGYNTPGSNVFLTLQYALQ